MWAFLKNNIKIISLAVIILGVTGVAMVLRSDETEGIHFIVSERGTIVSDVSVTGRVEPSKNVSLAFETGGRVVSIAARVGDEVYAGMALVRLSSDDVRAALAQAQARVKAEEAKLAELMRGSTPEAIAVKEVKVRNAETSLTEEKRNLILTLKDAYTKSDDAIRNKVDQFISSAESANPQIDFPVIDSQLEMRIEAGRLTMTSALTAWILHTESLSIESEFNDAIVVAKDYLDQTKRFLENVSIVVNAVKTSATLSQAIIDSYRADVSTARTNVNTALSNIIAAEKKVRDAVSTLLLTQEELVEARAGTRLEQIAAQEAKLEEAQAIVWEKEALVSKTVLVSPITGVITKQDAEVGEIVEAYANLVQVISDANFEIKTNIPEADIAKVSEGDAADVTLDAYGSDSIFFAHVSEVELAETILEGVATYSATLNFDTADPRIRSGMTANVDIHADRKDDVITVPARAVITRNGEKIVRILGVNDEIVEVVVTVGLRGSDGTLEIVSGISEGDRVITFVDEARLQSNVHSNVPQRIQEHF